MPDAAELADVSARRVVVPLGFLIASLSRARALGPVLAHALRLRGAGDRRLAARRALRGHAHAAEDPRGHGALGRDRRARRREPGRRLHAHARRSPTGLQAAAFGYTGIVVAALARYNPFAVVPRRGAPRRAAERRLHAAGRRLPVRARRRHAGDHPLLRARRRAARSATACGIAPARRAREAASRTAGCRERERQHRSSSCSRRRCSTGRRSSTRRSASCWPSARACSTSASRG